LAKIEREGMIFYAIINEIIDKKSVDCQKENFKGLKGALNAKRRAMDGISACRLSSAKKSVQKRVVLVDSVVFLPKEKILKKEFKPPVCPKNKFNFLNFFFGRKKFSYALVCFLLLGSFILGMQTVLRTDTTRADEEAPQAGNLKGQYIVLVPASETPVSQVPNDVLFNLSIDQLESYLSEAFKTDEVREAELLEQRMEKIQKYLLSKKSPLAKYSDTIASQKHWKLILAISNAESGFGKHCANNNCSGIGVAPGHLTWREYKTMREWVLDFNSLLEKKYKDWTLEQMNGVYVQPKNPNWLLATKQVLEEIQELGIE
jgi:hypothetical protein